MYALLIMNFAASFALLSTPAISAPKLVMASPSQSGINLTRAYVDEDERMMEVHVFAKGGGSKERAQAKLTVMAFSGNQCIFSRSSKWRRFVHNRPMPHQHFKFKLPAGTAQINEIRIGLSKSHAPEEACQNIG